MSKRQKNSDNWNETVMQTSLALEHISRSYRALMWNACKTKGLSPLQFRVLIFLQDHDEECKTITYLAKEFQVSKATLSEVAKTLLSKKLVKKVKNKVDKRSYHLEVTVKGSRKIGVAKDFAYPIHEALVRFTKKDQKEILKYMTRIIEHLGSNANGKGPQLAHIPNHFVRSTK